MEPDMDYLCGSACITKHMKCWRKPVNKKMVDGIKMTNIANLCQTLGGLRKASFSTMKSYWKTIPSLQQNKKEVGTRNLGNFRWMQRAYKDHWISAVTLNWRSRHAKDCTKNIQRSLEVDTNLSLQSNKSRQRRHQQFERLEAYDYRLEASTGWRYYPSSTTHSSSSSRWQPSSDLWSTWNWTRGNLHPGLNSVFFQELFQWCHFACQKFNLVAIDCGVKRTLAVHTFFSCVFCQRACPSLLSQLSR